MKTQDLSAHSGFKKSANTHAGIFMLFKHFSQGKVPSIVPKLQDWK